MSDEAATPCALRVLLVEDNALNEELARDLLESAQHVVDAVPDGVTFRAYLQSGGRPDVVLMDILLPDADGEALLRELRASALSAIPVVALTAHALEGTRARLLAAGFDDVWTKPIDTRAFVGSVERRAQAGRS